MNKKTIIVATIIAINMFVLGCGEETKVEEKNVQTEIKSEAQIAVEKQAAEEEQKRKQEAQAKADAELNRKYEEYKQKQAALSKISKKASIGATKNAFEEEHKLTEQTMFSIYDDKRFLVLYDNNRIISITIQTPNKEEYNEQMIEAMMPEDAQNVKRITDNTDDMLMKEKITGTSEKLKQVVPTSQGEFEILNVFDKASGNYIKTIIE